MLIHRDFLYITDITPRSAYAPDDVHEFLDTSSIDLILELTVVLKRCGYNGSISYFKQARNSFLTAASICEYDRFRDLFFDFL